MLRLAALLVVLGGLAAAVLLVPLRGRTVAQRWHSAPGAAAFLASGWDEIRGRPERGARRTKPRDPRGPAAPPVERHTDSDRRALERLLSERSR